MDAQTQALINRTMARRKAAGLCVTIHFAEREPFNHYTSSRENAEELEAQCLAIIGLPKANGGLTIIGVDLD